MSRALTLSAAITLCLWQEGLSAYPAGLPIFQPTPRTRAAGALALRHISTCVFERDRGGALALLRSAPGSRDEQRVISGLQSRMEQCFNIDAVAIQYTSTALRGAFAESGFLAGSSVGLNEKPSTGSTLQMPAEWMRAYRKAPAIGPLLALHQFATCVVAAAPLEVARLIRTVPGSSDEDMIFAALNSVLGPCVSEGQSFASDKATLRALLSEALFHRFVDADQFASVH